MLLLSESCVVESCMIEDIEMQIIMATCDCIVCAHILYIQLTFAL